MASYASSLRPHTQVGSGALGRMGHILVDLTVVLSQLGFSCAYLIFISQNLLPYLRYACECLFKSMWLPMHLSRHSCHMWRAFRPALPSEAAIVWALGTQFTCFTSTKVHMLMQKALLVPLLVALSWIRTLDTLAPFSGVALALIFSGLLAVTWY